MDFYIKASYKAYIFLCWQDLFIKIACITLTATPSSNVEVNQMVTIECILDPNPTPPVIMSLRRKGSDIDLCQLEPNDGKCKNSSFCKFSYNASCASETVFSIQVKVPLNWNGTSLYCRDQLSDNESNYITFSVTVPVSSVTLTPTSITVTEGQQMNLTCETSYCYPTANIVWYSSLTDITNQSKYITNKTTGLVKTISLLTTFVYRSDEEKKTHCTASNKPGGTVMSTISTLIVHYKPAVELTTPNPYIVEEGQTAALKCIVTAANPNTDITWKWFNTDSPSNVLHNGPNYTISDIQRNMSGSYNCIASNTVGPSKEAITRVDVQYKPTILEETTTMVHEGDQVILTRGIVSNPLANAFWYNGSQLVKTQSATNNASFTINKTLCTDTKNYTLLASNEVEQNVTALVELIVYCKPKSFDKNITIGVTDTTGIKFSTTVIAYPEPYYELQNDNGTTITKMTDSITKNAVYNFTIFFNQSSVKQDDYGTYHLKVNNSYGETIISVNVIPQRRPNMPKVIELVCDVRQATLRWVSSFNGGDSQSFTAVALNGQGKEIKSDIVSDKGEKKLHFTFVHNLEPSTAYVFYVSAYNKHGLSPSQNISCITLEVPSDSLPVIAGGSAAAGIILAVILTVVVVLLRRYTRHGKQARKSQRLKQEDESKNSNDDGLKDNILYISAGPKVDQSEAAVYAEVNKKGPESNNNANMYAEVKKGFSKNGGSQKNDAKPKQKKGKKKKSKQDVADVYENSEDIAMASNMDCVYSNAGHKDQNKEERGYKNKDGLLYVEVKLDATSNKGNPVIHGEDEKTDYATVDFPMPTTPNKVTGDDKI